MSQNNKFVYAIHKETVWRTDYCLILLSSKSKAEAVIEEVNKPYNEWNEKRKNFDQDFHNMRYVYENPQPPKYVIEKRKLL